MKRLICVMTAVALSFGHLFADEGMWLLPLIQKMNGKALKEAGCRLTPKQIYDINNTSLKDAIVQFGGGCTGEVVSSEGLLLTNHHCGYGNIQKLSSVEHDYLKDGYWAMNRSEELPCEGLTVTFLKKMTDVTEIAQTVYAEALAAYADSTDREMLAQRDMYEALEKLAQKEEELNPTYDAMVESFYDENVWYIITYQTFLDIRFVGAPPSSIGKFGADTDNWMWPRHTGDFSVFRIYSDKNGNPAEYSEDNVPYQAPNHLKISLKGIKENDFTMIMGYPGTTTRFQTSPELEQQIRVNDIRIAARTIKQEKMMEDMLADPAIKIKYANKYAGSSNGWKKWQGMKLAFSKLGIIERAQKEEAEFTKWVNQDPARQAKYGTVLADLKEGIEIGAEAKLYNTKVTESLYSIEIIRYAWTFYTTTARAIQSGKDTLSAAQEVFGYIAPRYKDYSVPTDKKIAKALIAFYRDNVDAAYAAKYFGEGFASADIDAYVDSLFATSVFVSADKISETLEQGGFDAFRNDPALSFASAMAMSIAELSPTVDASEDKLAKARKAYTAGLLEWKAGEPSYPDANFTMRLTYGHVLPYSPKDGIDYRYYTTLEGVMEKEDPDNWEFVVPARLKELYEKKDFGEYAMKDGRMPVAFLSNNDITGGNSGSPIMNAKGELIGLAFDGNWESMSSDVMFEPDLQRCINVDIRYVLFIIDKFGGARHLVDEMTIVR